MTPSSPAIWETPVVAWSEDLARLSLPFDTLTLDPDVAALWADAAAGNRLELTARDLPASFLSDVGALIEGHPGGSHLKLDLCSLKQGGRVPRFRSAEDLLADMGRANPRVAASLRLQIEERRDVTLAVFPWQDMPRWTEFRIFVRDGTVIGVSQYHSASVLPEIGARIAAIQAAFAEFCPRLLGALHLPDCAADVFVQDGAGPADPLAVRLIELNPLVRRTDPCLYTWKGGGDFDGTLRYLAAT